MNRKLVHGGDVYRHPGVIDFSANMNPLGIPEAVVRAAAEGVSRSLNYPDVKKEELLAALAAYEQVKQEYLTVGNGAAEVIFTFALATKPKQAMVLAPTFAEYEQALASVDCDVSYYDLLESDDFRVTDRILSAITDELDVLVLCNPNNPTGHLMPRALVLSILERAKETHTRVLLDECFLDFCEDQSAECHDVLEDYPQLFILKAFTKRYAMAGLRLGYGMTADLELLERMARCVQPWNVSIPAQMAGVAALKEETYLERALELIRTERAFLIRALSELGYRVMDSKANYIFFQGTKGLEQRVLEHDVMIRSCANYRQLDDTWFRVAVRTHEENLKLLEALRNG